MDIDKFPVPHHLLKKSMGMNGEKISQFDLEESIKNAKMDDENASHRWIFELIPYIKAFSKKHSDHDVRIGDDSGPDYYWWPENKGYADWKEITTNLTNELFLPRNLVEDLKITEWTEAENYLKTLTVVLYDEIELTEFKAKFDQLIRINTN